MWTRGHTEAPLAGLTGITKAPSPHNREQLAMIYRVSIANLSPEQLAAQLSARGLDGTAVPAVGFTAEWGTEPAALAILAGTNLATVQNAVRSILRQQGEEAAYVDVDGEHAFLLDVEGDETPLVETVA